VKTLQEGTADKEWALPDTKSANALILDFPDSTTVGDKFLLFINYPVKVIVNSSPNAVVRQSAAMIIVSVESPSACIPV
jgi:hypothetical protein